MSQFSCHVPFRFRLCSSCCCCCCLFAAAWSRNGLRSLWSRLFCPVVGIAALVPVTRCSSISIKTAPRALSPKNPAIPERNALKPGPPPQFGRSLEAFPRLPARQTYWGKARVQRSLGLLGAQADATAELDKCENKTLN